MEQPGGIASGAGDASGAALRIVFERQYRTPQSEGYHILVADRRIAHLDVHYTQTNVYATLIVEGQVAEDQVLDLIERIDESIVLSAETPREDLLVTVYQGSQTGLYNDDFLEERRERRGTTETPRTSRAARQRNVN
jgi:hypothetical protein